MNATDVLIVDLLTGAPTGSLVQISMIISVREKGMLSRLRQESVKES